MTLVRFGGSAAKLAPAPMLKQYTVRARTDFSAAHVLHGYAGACNRVHGHNFRVEAEVVAGELDDVGMAIDFTLLETELATIAQAVDHRLLNDVPPFTEVNPTAENLAAFFWTELSARLEHIEGGSRVRLTAVTVSETDRSSVTYTERRSGA